jgi:hypothetical protein
MAKSENFQYSYGFTTVFWGKKGKVFHHQKNKAAVTMTLTTIGPSKKRRTTC